MSGPAQLNGFLHPNYNFIKTKLRPRYTIRMIPNTVEPPSVETPPSEWSGSLSVEEEPQQPQSQPVQTHYTFQDALELKVDNQQ